MSKGKVRAAVIGLGVGEKHIVGYEKHPDCQVVALCDTDPAKLADVAARNPGQGFDRRLTTDPFEILNDRGIDVVSIASYDDAHHAQIMAALATDKHVFVEKPLCLHDHEHADIAAALRAKPHLKMTSNLILRRCPRFLRLKGMIERGEFGPVYYMEGDYNYGRVHKITEGWRGQIPFYSVVHGGAIHLLDLLMWLSGRKPVEVTAMGNKIVTQDTAFRYNDLGVSLVRFDDGAIAKVSANFGCVMPHFHNLAIYGIRQSFQQTPLGAALFQSRDPAVPPEPVTEAYPGAEKGDLIAGFIAHILGGPAPDVTAEDVLNAMAVSLAIEASVQSGAPVPVTYR